MGVVGRGLTSGGLSLVAKMREEERYMSELFYEARQYTVLGDLGMGDFLPLCYGVFRGKDLTVMLLEDVGVAFESWRDCTSEQL